MSPAGDFRAKLETIQGVLQEISGGRHFHNRPVDPQTLVLR